MARPLPSGGAVHKLLVFKSCCIGDVLFSTPSVRALRKAFPLAEVVYLVGDWSRDVAGMIPRVDRVIRFPEPARPLALLRLLLALRRERFDLAVSFHRSASAHALLALAGIPVRAGFDWKGSGRWLTHPAPFDEKAHEVRRYFAVLAALGVEPDGESTEIAAPPAERESAAVMLGASGVPEGKRLAVIFPGGGRNPGTVMMSKRWTPLGWNAVARWLAGERGFSVAVVGDSSEKDLAVRVLEGVPGGVSLAGRTDLKGLAGIISHAAWFAGVDSGPTHMAAALGVPTLTVFGPTDPRLVAPPGATNSFVWRKIDCAPCYEPGTVHSRRFLECRDHKCLQELPAENVLTVAREQLDRMGI